MKFKNFFLITLSIVWLSCASVYCQGQKPIIELAKNQDTLKIIKYDAFKIPKPQKVDFINNRYKAEISTSTPISFQKMDLINDPAFKFEDLEVSIEVVPAGYPKLTKASKPSRKIDASYDIRYLNQEHGLPTLNLLTTFLDSKGMLWLSIRGGGVIRYDGQYFAEFGIEQGFKGKWISGIHEDKNGNLWFSDSRTSSFAIKYNGNTFSYYSYEGSVGRNYSGIAENSNGDLFFATDHGLIIFDGSEFQIGIKDQYIFNIDIDKQNRLWIDGKNGLYRLKENNLQRLDEGSYLMDREIVSFLLGSKDKIWLSTRDEFGKYDIKKIQNDSIISISNLVLFKDNHLEVGAMGLNDALWINTFNGLMKFDGTYFEKISQNEGMTFDNCIDLVSDNSRTVWVTGRSSGLNILREGVINFTGSPDFNVVESIFTDSHKRVWLSIRYKGVFSLDSSDLYKYNILPKLNYKINEIYEDAKGRLWFSTWYPGLLCKDGDSIVRYDLPNDAKGVFNSIAEQANGDLWFGTLRAGLFKFDGKSFVHYNIRGYDSPNMNYLHVNNIYASIVDAKDRVWFATNEGIAVYKDGKFEDYSTIVDLKGATPYALFEDTTGNIWIGTNGDGLFKFDGINSSNYTIEDGLASNKIEALSGSESGGLWIGTALGVNYIDHENLSMKTSEKPVILTFNRNEGLRGLSVFRNGLTEDKSGNLWVGTSESLTRISPQIISNTEAPVVTLLNVDYKNNNILNSKIQNDSSKVADIPFSENQSYYNVPSELSIPYKSNRLNFNFTAIDWSGPYDIQFQTQLVGLDNSWNPMSSSVEASYSLLPYGNYIFKVRAIGHIGVWSETVSFPFTIYPPWWHSWWARTIYGILFILFMLGIIRIRTRILLQQKGQLEDEIKKRTVELKKAQVQLIQSEKMASLGQLTAGIAHEMNNPVSFTQTSSYALDQDLHDIKQLIEKYRTYIHNTKEDTSEIEEFESSIDFNFLINEINQSISDIKEGTKRTSEIVNNLRKFSYRDHAEKEPADIHQGIDATLNILKSRFSKNISLIKNYDSSIGLVTCHMGQINQVFMNLISNALDATGEKGEIIITTKNHGNSVLISIKDNGDGIAKEVIKNIFDPFFTTKKIGKGVGLGLSISHGIIENHGGTISVDSTLGKGAQLDIVLPKS